METRDTLLMPQTNAWQARLVFGAIFLVISAMGLMSSIRLASKPGYSWNCFGNLFVLMLVFSLLVTFVQRIHEFNRQDQSLTTYWAIGIPIGLLIRKLPWIWRDYPGKRITYLKIYRTGSIDTDDYAQRSRIITYDVKARIGRKMIHLGSYGTFLNTALKDARKVGEFIGVPVDDSSL